MADENLANELMNREREALEIALVAGVSRTTVNLQEFIQLRLSQGAAPEAIRNTLLRDLETGGRIFGEFRSSIRSTAKGSVNRIRDTFQYSEHGVDRKFRWSAVLVSTCDDCIDNHGKVMTWDQWEASGFGLPRSGGTICRHNCKCVLLPAEATELEPLPRSARAEAKLKGRL